LYVYDFYDSTVGKNTKDNMHTILTYDKANEIYYESPKKELARNNWIQKHYVELVPPNYVIASLDLKSFAGEVLEKIPKNQAFKVELSVKKNDLEITDECLFIALYDKNNTLINLLTAPEITESIAIIDVPASDKK